MNIEIYQKYELTRHKAVHENIIYKCPYCGKVVKRKPSIIKHLQIAHKELEQTWNQVNLVEEVTKKPQKAKKSAVNASTLPSNKDSSSTSSKIVHSPSDSSNDIDRVIESNQANGIHTKPRKKGAAKSHVKKYNNYSKIKKMLYKNHKMSPEHLKRVKKSKSKLATLPSTDENEFVDGTVDQLMPPPSQSSSTSAGRVAFANDPIGITTECDSSAKNNVILSNIYDNINNNTNLNEKSMIDGGGATSTGIGAVNATSTTRDDITNNIIDDCFFVDESLNCNVLASPFSSDNDVDGFLIANANNGDQTYKELLNKFHDRLEEM